MDIRVDHSSTFVLLIGSSNYPEDKTINPIPNIVENINSLRDILQDNSLIGVPKSNIIISLDEEKNRIERKLHDLAERTRNKKFTILIYYSGHGILSSKDYQLYLTTHNTCKEYLESDAISIEQFKKYIKRSLAGRKIVILDCCHSGAILGSMGDMNPSLQIGLQDFEGAYIMTSAAEDSPSLFSLEEPMKPTYFTEKLVEVIKEGVDGAQEYCNLRDIFNKIESDFRQRELPIPQQWNSNKADQLFFSKNNKFKAPLSDDEVVWIEAVAKNSKWSYLDFKKKFPQSVFSLEATDRIYQLDEEEAWVKAKRLKNLTALISYIESFPTGKHLDEANLIIEEIRKQEEHTSEFTPSGEKDDSTRLNSLNIESKIADFENTIIQHINNEANKSKLVTIQVPDIQKQNIASIDNYLVSSISDNSEKIFKKNEEPNHIAPLSDNTKAVINEQDILMREEEEFWQRTVKQNKESTYFEYLENSTLKIHEKECLKKIDTLKKKKYYISLLLIIFVTFLCGSLIVYIGELNGYYIPGTSKANRTDSTKLDSGKKDQQNIPAHLKKQQVTKIKLSTNIAQPSENNLSQPTNIINAPALLKATFPGGKEVWLRYLQRHIKSEVAQDNGAPIGTYNVIVSFLIDLKGETSEVVAVKDPGFGTAQEVIRVIEQSPHWIPASQNGRTVIYRQRQSVTFEVTNETDSVKHS